MNTPGIKANPTKDSKSLLRKRDPTCWLFCSKYSFNNCLNKTRLQISNKMTFSEAKAHRNKAVWLSGSPTKGERLKAC